MGLRERQQGGDNYGDCENPLCLDEFASDVYEIVAA